MTHGLVLGLIDEQAAKLAVDHVPLSADQLQRAGCGAMSKTRSIWASISRC